MNFHSLVWTRLLACWYGRSQSTDGALTASMLCFTHNQEKCAQVFWHYCCTRRVAAKVFRHLQQNHLRCSGTIYNLIDPRLALGEHERVEKSIHPNSGHTEQNHSAPAYCRLIGFSSSVVRSFIPAVKCAPCRPQLGKSSQSGLAQEECFNNLTEDHFHQIQLLSPWHARLMPEDSKRGMFGEFSHTPRALSVWASHVCVRHFPRLSCPSLNRFPETAGTWQDRIKICARLTCGCRASRLSVCHVLTFSVSLVPMTCRFPFSCPPLLLSCYTSLFLCLFGPQVTTFLPPFFNT